MTAPDVFHPSRRGIRGPRKAAEPRGDIKARLAKVNKAFMLGDYDNAQQLVSEVIRINAETHQAWTALSSIFREQGQLHKALMSMVYAAHLRPKILHGWIGCGNFALELPADDDDDDGNLKTARLCFSTALRLDATNEEARLGRAVSCHRLGIIAPAIADYNFILRRRPYNLEVVRKLAEACVDIDRSHDVDSAVSSAISAYQRCWEHMSSSLSTCTISMSWFDAGIYAELFASVGKFKDAIQELKRVGRHLVGRASETYWSKWVSDDREWDYDAMRRDEVPDFHKCSFNEDLYGSSLPCDIRARLSIYRLSLGEDAEAMVCRTLVLPF